MVDRRTKSIADVCKSEPTSLRKLGEEFGISGERVRQIIVRENRKIRRNIWLVEQGVAVKTPEMNTELIEIRHSPRKSDQIRLCSICDLKINNRNKSGICPSCLVESRRISGICSECKKDVHLTPRQSTARRYYIRVGKINNSEIMFCSIFCRGRYLGKHHGRGMYVNS